MAILTEIRRFVAEWESDSPFIIAHTSGSTGTPKEIHLPKEIVCESARRTIDFFGLDASSRLHLCLSPDYIAGKMMIVRGLLSGAGLTCEEPSNHILQGISSDEEITLLAIVPSQLEDLIIRAEALPRIENIIVGGAPLTASQREKASGSGLNIFETYGMTETASHIALRRLTNPASSFRALDGIRVSLDDRGCMVVESPEFGRIVTNDIAELTSKNEFLIVDRADSIINSGGVKISPVEVESRIQKIIEKYFGKVNYCVSKVFDSKWGEIAILAVEAAEQSSLAVLDEIKELIGSKKSPKRVIFVKHIPVSDTSKILRKQLEKELLQLICGNI